MIISMRTLAQNHLYYKSQIQGAFKIKKTSLKFFQQKTRDRHFWKQGASLRLDRTMSSQPSWIVRINLRGLGEKTCCCFHHTFVIGFLRALLTKFEILVLQTQNTIRDGGRTALKTAYTAYILLTSLILL